MTLEEFVAKYKGQHVEFDGAYLNQCVDLVQFYNKEVIEAPPLKGNAKDYAANPQPNYYEFFYNHLWYIPPRGAIAVWNSNVGGGFGHVAIVLTANIMKFTSLDQNWGTDTRVSEVEHEYKNVIGFLVRRPQNLFAQYNLLVDELRKITNRFPKI